MTICTKKGKICAKSDPMPKLPIQFSSITLISMIKGIEETGQRMPLQIRCGSLVYS